MNDAAHIKPLTGLRFFAAMWVVLYHYWPNLQIGVGSALVSHKLSDLEAREQELAETIEQELGEPNESQSPAKKAPAATTGKKAAAKKAPAKKAPAKKAVAKKAAARPPV